MWQIAQAENAVKLYVDHCRLQCGRPKNNKIPFLSVADNRFVESTCTIIYVFVLLHPSFLSGMHRLRFGPNPVFFAIELLFRET